MHLLAKKPSKYAFLCIYYKKHPKYRFACARMQMHNYPKLSNHGKCDQPLALITFQKSQLLKITKYKSPVSR